MIVTFHVDEDMLNGMNCFFNNKFSEARAIFEKRAKEYV